MMSERSTPYGSTDGAPAVMASEEAKASTRFKFTEVLLIVGAPSCHLDESEIRGGTYAAKPRHGAIAARRRNACGTGTCVQEDLGGRTDSTHIPATQPVVHDIVGTGPLPVGEETLGMTRG
jgi:hypothetical protein